MNRRPLAALVSISMIAGCSGGAADPGADQTCSPSGGECGGLTVCCPGSDQQLSCLEPAQCVPARRTLWVSTVGDDGNDGLSAASPFRTISHAATAVGPGDLVLVRGGTYFEHVRLTVAGTETSPIIYRAMPDETAEVTFGQWPSGWQAMAGTRFGYQTSYAYPPAFVWEHRTVSRYMEAPNPTVLDDTPGSFIYDREAQTLHVHALHGSHPDEAMIVVVPFGGPTEPSATDDYQWEKGFWPYQPEEASLFNHLEDFTISYQPIGIQLRMPDCQARGNKVYGCTAGIEVYRGSRQLIEANEVFLNYGPGIHLGAAGETDIVVRDNRLWDNGPNAPFRGLEDGGGGHPYSLAAYGGPESFSVIDNAIIAFDPEREIFPSSLVRYKAIQQGTVVTRGNLLVGGGAAIDWGGEATVVANTVVGSSIRDRVTGDVITPDYLAEHPDLAGVIAKNVYLDAVPGDDAGFADPQSQDYRLRADSPLLAGGEGAFPDPVLLRYVRPDGDDAASGRTPAQAWRSLEQALASSAPGETIYLLPGTYSEPLRLGTSGTAAQPIEIKNYGGGEVILQAGTEGAGLDTGLEADGVAHVRVSGIVLKGFATGAVLRQAQDVELTRVVFDGATQGLVVEGGADLRVVNDTFVRTTTGVAASQLQGALILRNNLFSELSGTPLSLDAVSLPYVVSERNGFADPSSLGAWTAQVTEAIQSLVDVTALGLTTEGGYRLPIGSGFGFQGLWHRPIGARGAVADSAAIVVERFQVEGVMSDRAVLSWSTPRDFVDGVVSGLPEGSFEVAQEEFLKSTSRRFRVQGLTPGTDYHVTLAVHTQDGRTGSAELDFTTLAVDPAPTTLYVSPSGDDASSGRSPAEPLRTVGKALVTAPPGSTVQLAPGTYAEELEIWWGGRSESQPLVLKGEVAGEAVIDSGGYRDAAIIMDGVSDVVIEGLRFQGLRYSDNAYAVRGYQVSSITLRDNVFDPQGWPADDCTNLHVFFDYADDITISNNLFVHPFEAVIVWHGNEVTVDHNTFYRAGTHAIYLHGKGNDAYPDNVWRVTNNIVVDAVGNHTYAAVLLAAPSPNLVCDHNLYVRTTSVPTMYLFGYDDDGSGSAQMAFTLEEVRSLFALEAHGAFADTDAAVFTDAPSGDLSLAAGSPGLGMDDAGGDVGYQAP